MVLWRSILGLGRLKSEKKAVGTPAIRCDELMLAFESLGDNCEFGVAQRLCGAEPLGLFRFNATILSNLVETLREDLEGLFDSQDLEVYDHPYDGQYACRSRRFRDFEYLSGVWPSTIGLDEFHAKHVEKNDYLKRRLRETFREGDKIFVRKGRDSDRDSILDLYEAIKSYGAGKLLLVLDQAEDKDVGTVELIRPDLAVGFVSRFAPHGDVRKLVFDDWIAVCRNAYAAFNGPVAFEESTPFHESADWNASASRAVSRVGTCSRITLLTDATYGEDCLRCVIDTKPSLRDAVFSTWLWLPEGSSCETLEFIASDCPNQRVQPANIARRGRWQRIWCGARLPGGAEKLAFSLRVVGRAGDYFLLSSWLMEDGAIPTRRSPPAAPPPAALFGEMNPEPSAAGRASG